MLTTSKYTPFTTLSIATGCFYNCKSGYSFRFNGQEQDNEVAGTGNIMTAEFWMYDGRLGRRWNVDPKPNEAVSAYACLGNNPIILTDINGDTTSYFDRIGNFLGQTFDLLENQVHFMESKNQFDKIMNENKGKSENEKAKALRSKSIAFYDSKTEAEMYNAYKASPDKEIGFGLVFKHAPSLELTFVKCISCKSLTKEEMEAKRRLNPEFRGQYGVDLEPAIQEFSKSAFLVFLIGHSHPKNSFHDFPGNPTTPGYSERKGWNGKPIFQTLNAHQIDYEMHSATPIPLMIISKSGINIYTGLQKNQILPPDEFGTHPNFDDGHYYNWGNHFVRESHY